MDKKTNEPFKKLLEAAGKNKYVLAVLLVGAVLILFPFGSSGGKSAAGGSEEITYQVFSLEELERKMEAALSQIDGAGKVSVVLTLKSSVEQQLAQDSDVSNKTSGQGETTGYDMDHTITTVVISAGSGTQAPVVVKYIYPEYLGALVISEGAGDASVRLRMTEAVAALTGLKSDKISVVKMSQS